MTKANTKIELLAPGGSVEAIKAAIVAGANAIYCGMDNFNARNRASNLSFDDLTGILRLAHQHGCQIFLTVNVVILETEIPALFKFLSRLVNTRIDGIIVQDLGVFNLVKKHFPSLDIHASTQLTTINEGQIKFLSKIGASRLNLSRELNLQEIKTLTTIAHEEGLLTEVFVHGSLCIAFSGQCYSSSVSVGNSGNRGRCSQACRDEYETTSVGTNFPLNLKDNSAYFELPELVEAGVDSLKIEGRIKGAHYVYTVVDSWRKNINHFVKSKKVLKDDANLHKVFNRDFTNSFLQADLTKDAFIDNPRDHSITHAVEKSDAVSIIQIQKVKDGVYTDRDTLGLELRDKIKDLSIEKPILNFTFSGKLNQPLTVSVITDDEEKPIVVNTTSLLVKAGKVALDFDGIAKRFKNISATYKVGSFDFSRLSPELSIPFKEITQLKNKVAYLLNDSNEVLLPIEAPILENHSKTSSDAALSILINEEDDLSFIDDTQADIYFKLPESYKKDSPKYINLLLKNPRLIPWFPAVLIGKDYLEAVKILEQVKPHRIISNNTGIAYKAFEMGIEWLAGPFLNTTNSYALMTLKEELNCAGAFISNEINQMQIKKIARPENFTLHYSIYHPILMMVSRQCFFQQTVGCNKPSIEDGCMLKCKKTTTITNKKGVSFAIDKQKGGYPSIYNSEQFLNIDIIKNLSEKFDGFLIDLTDIGTVATEGSIDKTKLIKHFEDLLDNKNMEQAQKKLSQMVTISTNQQYIQGL